MLRENESSYSKHMLKAIEKVNDAVRELAKRKKLEGYCTKHNCFKELDYEGVLCKHHRNMNCRDAAAYRERTVK